MSRDVSLVDLIVHEMRTPLTVALGSLRQAQASEGDAAQAAWARAQRSCERLELLAAEMRDFVRVAALPDSAAAPVRLDAVVDRAVAALSAQLDVEVDLGAVARPLAVRALPGRLETAVTSLLMALARAASPGEGLVLAAAASAGTVTMVARRAQSDAPASDGFAAEWIGGNGFSLPLAKAIVERGGGRLASSLARDGRLGAISVTLAAAPEPPA